MKNSNSLIETICRQTGISRRDLAILIGGHQSNLSRYQKGERDLPTANLLEMNDLYALLRQLEPEPLPDIPMEEQSVLEEQAAKCQASCTLLKQQLKEMQAIAKQCQMAEKMAEKLLLNKGISPQKRSWAEMIKLSAQKKLRAYSRLEQGKLAIRINLLTKEAYLYKKLVRTGTVQPK
jgi:transcriptional regulator with XRE-family HTH domain